MNKKAYLIAFAIYYIFIVFSFLFFYDNPLNYFFIENSDMTEAEQVLWVMLFLPVWCFSFFQSEQELSIGEMAMYRYQKINHWWKRMHINILTRLSLTYLGMMIGLFNEPFVNVKVWITLLLHSLFLYEIGIMIWFLSKRMVLSAIVVILLEGAGYSLVNTYGISPCYYPFCWGRYGFSRLQYGKDGYSIRLVTIVQIVIILFVVFIFDLKFCRNSTVGFIIKNMHEKD